MTKLAGNLPSSEEYRQKVQARLSGWDEAIVHLEKEVDKTKTEDRDKYQEQVRQLRTQKRAIVDQLDAFITADAQRQQTLKPKLDATIEAFDKRLTKISADLEESGGQPLGWLEGLSDKRPDDSEGWVEGLGEDTGESEGWVEGLGKQPKNSKGWLEGYDKTQEN